LTVLTGETGAGKSLVVDALSLLAGERADPSLVRAGAERAVVEGAFVSDDPEVRRVLEEGGFDVGEAAGPGDGVEVIVRREIAGGGKGRLFLNGSPAVLRTLSEIGPRLLVLYGQAEARELLDASSARELLDRFAGCAALAGETASLHAAWREKEQERARIEEAGSRREERLELLNFQIAEIDAVNPLAGEEESLSAEKTALSTVEKRGDLLSSVVGALESDEAGALPALAAARRSLAALTEADPSHGPALAALQEAIERLSDVAAELSKERERLEANPRRLEEVAERLGGLAKLRRKYGPTLQEVLAHRERIGRESDELSDIGKAIARAADAEARASRAYEKKAIELSGERAGAAPRLSTAVVRHLKELAFLSSRFGVEVTRKEGRDAWASHGMDVVAFAFAPNPGEPPRALSKIASGGELSRVQLALAAALSEEEEKAEARGQKAKEVRPKGAPVRTFVFDEVDAGVSGSTAAAVGKKLRRLAASGQILVVTHLPQVAAAGESHLSVAKETSRGRTKTRVTGLDEGGRIEAIASMLDGVSVGDAARRQALELLRSSSHRSPR
jgi:DNA repair protein RecN (Recombination protein N)